MSAQAPPQMKNTSHLHRALIKLFEYEFGALPSTTAHCSCNLTATASESMKKKPLTSDHSMGLQLDIQVQRAQVSQDSVTAASVSPESTN